jgi:hypothetical protein
MLRSFRGFIPFIAFGVLNGFSDIRIAAVTAVVLSALLLLASRRAGDGLDEHVIEVSAGIFFAVLTLVAFLDPHTTLGDHTTALSSTWLALTAWGGLLFRKPFTMGIARRSVPQQVWENPMFYKVNVVISSVWAAAFTVTAVAATVIGLLTTHGGTAVTVIQVLGFVVPAVFTVRYQAAVGRRAATLGTA